MIDPMESIDYPIYFKNSLIELGKFIQESSYSRIFFLVDRHTAEYCLPVVMQALPELSEYDVIEIEPGEENKNIDFCIGIWNMLLDFGADRKSLLINVGGGVVGDMGSFAASTFKRGIDFVQVPTTLLSQVDASVGGKTGIDLNQVKNCIGTFSQPKAVFIESIFLNTLDNRQLNSGFAEMLKHGLISDKSYFTDLQNLNLYNLNNELIYKSVLIKNEIVKSDPKEQSIRKILNFGHTIGHAVESYFLGGPSPLLHGEALAIGIICEAFISHKHNGLSADELNQIVETIKQHFPLVNIPAESYPQVLEYMYNDKKNEKGKIGFALLNKIGGCDFDRFATREQIIDSLNFYQNLLA